MRTRPTPLFILAVVLTAALLTGCQGTGQADLAEVQTLIHDTQADLEALTNTTLQAKATAEAAAVQAHAAGNVAAEAKAKAEAAQADKVLKVEGTLTKAAVIAQAGTAVMQGGPDATQALTGVISTLPLGPWGPLAGLGATIVYGLVKRKQAATNAESAKSIADAVQALKAHVPGAAEVLDSPKAKNVMTTKLTDKAFDILSNATETVGTAKPAPLPPVAP